MGRVCVLPPLLPELEECHGGPSPSSTSPHSARIELRLREFEPRQVSVESNRDSPRGRQGLYTESKRKAERKESAAFSPTQEEHI